MLRVVLILGFFGISPVWGVRASENIIKNPGPQISQIFRAIEELGNSKLQGRQAETSGGKQAARFIAQRFQAIGLMLGIPTTYASSN